MAARNIALIFRYLKLNLKKEYQYKTAFFTQIIMMILNDAFFILQWLIIFKATEKIGNYGFSEVMLLWGMSAGTYGVAHLFFANATSIGSLVYEGKLDVYLTQPKNVMINLICSRTSVSAIGDIVYGFIAFAIAGAKWWMYLAYIPACIVGGIIFTAIIICFQTLSFYVKRGSSIADMIHSSMTMFTNYPPVIFNIVVKIILFTIIPAGFIVFVPVEFMFINFNVWWLLAEVGVAIVLTGLAFLLFNLGLKKYNSGNLMGGRL